MIKKGDFVRFLNDEGQGIVTGFPREGIALVEDSSGFAFEHPLNELVLIENSRQEYHKYNAVSPDLREMLDRNMDTHAVKAAAKDFKSRYKERAEKGPVFSGDTLEIDLHIHELLDDYDRMSNAEIVEVQMDHFERMMNLAEVRKVRKVIFIHGVGQGVLRGEIRQYLKKYFPQCEFLDGNYMKYGYGATEVRFRK